MIEDKLICPHCGRPIHGRRYLMSVDPDRPGPLAILRGEAGERARLFLTVGLSVLAALLLVGLVQAIGQ